MKTALEYLICMKGADFVIEEYLEDADNTLLRLFVDELTEDRPAKLINRLIAENRNSKDGLAFLKPLILMDCNYGLEKYYEIAKEKNTLPGWAEEDMDLSLTRAIGQVSEKWNLEIIMKLAQLATKPGFKDKRFFGLYSSVTKAVRNIGQNAPEFTIQYLNGILKKEMVNEFYSFCNLSLQEIESQYNEQRDIAWNIEQVKKYMVQINLY